MAPTEDMRPTDSGEEAKRLTNLQYLHLAFTDTTIEGIEKLEQALPNCEIDY